MQIYVSKDGQQYGPYNAEQIREFLAQGSFVPTDFACQVGGTEWITIEKTLKEKAPTTTADPQRHQVPQKQPVQQQSTHADSLAKKKVILWSSIGGGVVVTAVLIWLLVGGSGSDVSESNQSSAESPDANSTLEKIIAEAIDHSRLELRVKKGEELHYIRLQSGTAPIIHDRTIPVEISEEEITQKPFSGASKSMDKNGQIIFLTQYKDGKQDGLTFLWSEKGQMLEKSTWEDGKTEGHFTAWHENGKKAAEGNFKDDKEHGLWVYYNEDGTEKERKTFNDGERFLKKEQDLARIRAEEELRRDEEFGKKYGKIIAEAINLKKLERKLNGGESLFYELNEQTLYSGWTKSIYDNGQIDSLLQLKDGKKDGVMTSWYENGQKAAEGNFKDGDLMSAVVWKPNGEKCPHTNIVDGNGVVVGYKDNGNEQYRFFFQDGKRVG
ncbi:GYF domain-containing protein [Verrucomicrobia bacterium]|nr:GYF domain-containing protein [Verrucomicrobiota bacterium]